MRQKTLPSPVDTSISYVFTGRLASLCLLGRLSPGPTVLIWTPKNPVACDKLISIPEMVIVSIFCRCLRAFVEIGRNHCRQTQAHGACFQLHFEVGTCITDRITDSAYLLPCSLLGSAQRQTISTYIHCNSVSDHRHCVCLASPPFWGHPRCCKVRMCVFGFFISICTDLPSEHTHTPPVVLCSIGILAFRSRLGRTPLLYGGRCSRHKIAGSRLFIDRK